ncbi:LysR family transcriptional regulator [Pseudonocardia halophobica]|uniref:LysR family transcriptional regulator n=1 Tax=Pseudonocardia halophobica TaxID=29401 RepID=UPI003D90D16B
MELRQARYFLAVVEHGGVAGAAAALGLAGPSVSQAVRALERELGAELFHRIGRGMVLTAAGRAFVGPARRIVRSALAADGAAVGPGGPVRGRLDVLASTYVAVHPVAGLVGAFRRAHPEVAVRIGALADDDDSAALVRQGHCELAFTHLPVPAPGLTVRELGRHEYRLVAPPDVDLPAADPLDLADLPDLPLIVVPQAVPVRIQIERELLSVGKRTRVAAVCHHREAIGALVLAGVGATFLERSVAERLAGLGAGVRALRPAVHRPHGVIYDPRRLSPAGQAFVAALG